VAGRLDGKVAFATAVRHGQGRAHALHTAKGADIKIRVALGALVQRRSASGVGAI
jgi:hypothetical protein